MEEGFHSSLLVSLMTLPLVNSSRQLEKRPRTFRTGGKKALVLGGERDGKGEGVRPLLSFMPPVDSEHFSLPDLVTASAWRNHIIWRAGVSPMSRSSGVDAFP